jgi:DNA-binding transcriptional LysR family regulator
VPASSAIRANNSEAVRQAVRSGYGIARLSELSVVDDIRTRRRYRLPADLGALREHIYPTRRHPAPRVRVLIDFPVEGVRRLNAHLAEAPVWSEKEIFKLG